MSPTEPAGLWERRSSAAASDPARGGSACKPPPCPSRGGNLTGGRRPSGCGSSRRAGRRTGRACGAGNPLPGGRDNPAGRRSRGSTGTPRRPARRWTVRPRRRWRRAREPDSPGRPTGHRQRRALSQAAEPAGTGDSRPWSRAASHVLAGGRPPAGTAPGGTWPGRRRLTRLGEGCLPAVGPGAPGGAGGWRSGPRRRRTPGGRAWGPGRGASGGGGRAWAPPEVRRRS